MSTALWPDAIGRLLRREELPADVVEQAMTSILSGEATDAQIAGFAVALRAKGETAGELAALVRTMLRFAERVDLSGVDGTVIDTCGTGGDRAGTVNVSTMAAFVAAAAGARVAKHGGRAASSQCGSADVLEALGVVIDLGPVGVARSVREAGIGFCFAPRFHAGLRFAAPARRELGTPTTFNFVAPIANPAGVKRQIVGVSDPAMAERLVAMLAELGTERALVFYGHDGLDELTVTTSSTVHELRDGTITVYDVEPTSVGLPHAERSALAGGDAAGNAEIVHKVLAGASGPIRDIVALNAAAALLVADLVDDLRGGVELAGEILGDGRAAATLDSLVRVTVAARESGDA
ncbi:MAG TPA: anthranilate phosphoribosyltransferase [Acidimicrobiia bacterium]|nr:anthranilate phosphoribosyltransferase [Acidimicrobiia bacterium]